MPSRNWGKHPACQVYRATRGEGGQGDEKCPMQIFQIDKATRHAASGKPKLVRLGRMERLFSCKMHLAKGRIENGGLPEKLTGKNGLASLLTPNNSRWCYPRTR